MDTTIALRRLDAGQPSEKLIAYITDPVWNEIKLVTLMGNDINPQTACAEAARELKKLALRFELLSMMPDPENTIFQLSVNTFGLQKLQERIAAFLPPTQQGE